MRGRCDLCLCCASSCRAQSTGCCSAGKDLLQAAASGQALPGGITTSWLLVVVTSDGAPAPANVLQAAAKAGVSWVAVLEGGLQAYLKAAAHQVWLRLAVTPNEQAWRLTAVSADAGWRALHLEGCSGCSAGPLSSQSSARRATDCAGCAAT